MSSAETKNKYLLSSADISERAKAIRRRIIKMNSTAGQGHTGADLSETDILATLFFHVLNVRRDGPDHPERDRFILSKGHGIGGLYCTLAEAGYMDESLLDTYLRFDSRLPGHPVRQKTPVIELNTGALGHGLSVAAGLALSAKLKGRHFRVFVLTGDGELQEGSVWEAAMSSSRFELGNLIVIVDRNGLQLADRTERIMPLEPLAAKWEAFGFEAKEVDGHDPAAMIDVIAKLDVHGSRPHVLIAKTTKGKGVSFIEDQAAWHHKIPVDEQVAKAIEELE